MKGKYKLEFDARVFWLIAGALFTPQASNAQDFPTKEDLPLEEIVVTGTRIKQRDLSSISPLTTLNLSEIEHSGSPTLEEVLNQFPQVVADFGRTSNNPGDGTARVNLRGLGAGRTLVLLNGRRVASSGVGSAVDVNNLPQSLVERVEIITGGASAVYGSDAIAGVVNFITREDFQGLTLDGSFGITERGDAETADINLAAGMNVGGGSGNILFHAGILERKSLRSGERAFTRTALQDDWQGNLTPGGSFSTPELVIFSPVSSGGGFIFPIFEPDGSFRAFREPEDRFNFAPDNYLQIPLTRYSAGLMANYDFSESVEAFAELALTRNESKQALAAVPVSGLLTINLDNPVLTESTRQMLTDNFAGENDLASFPFGRRMSEVGPRSQDQDREFMRAVIGLRGSLAAAWDFESWLTVSNASEDESLVNDVSRARFAQGLLVDPLSGNCFDISNGCVPVNVFGAGNISPEAADFLRVKGVKNRLNRDQWHAGLFVTGPLYTYRSGTVDAALGLEWRRDDGDFQADDILSTGDTFGFRGNAAVDGSEDVMEAYGELRLPLLSDASWADYAGLEMAARFSDYDHAGGHWTWKFGGEWAVPGGVRFRAMQQRSVRAPNISEMFEEQFSEVGSIITSGRTDPCSASRDPVGNGVVEKCLIQGLTPAQIGVFEALPRVFGEFIRGGNPDLEPEVAETTTLGLVWEPEFSPNLSLALDYYDMEIEDTIGQIDARSICFDASNTRHLFCENIQRDASGNIVRITEKISNRGKLRARGVDLQVSYATDLPTGFAIGAANTADLKIRAIWTHLLKQKQQENPVTDELNCAGRFGWPCYDGVIFDGGQTFARNRLMTSTTYTTGPVSVNMNLRWIQGTKNSAPLSLDFQSTLNAVLAIPEVDDKTYMDLAMAYRFSDRFEVGLNVNNLLETDPPQMADAVISNNTDTGTFDVFGRSYFISFSASL